MKLVHNNIQKHFDFSINPVQQLIVENHREFFNLTNQLYNQVNFNGEGLWVLSDDEILNLSKNAIIISDYYNLDCNSKKVQIFLNDEIQNALNSTDYFTELADINSRLIDLNSKLLESIDLPIDFNAEFSPDDLIKISKYRIMEETSLVQRIIAYVEIFAKLKNIKLIIFFNLSLILDERELYQLLKDLRYMDLYVFLLDGQSTKQTQGEITVIDNDLCEIQ